mgnify:CR=1 FL=1
MELKEFPSGALDGLSRRIHYMELKVGLDKLDLSDLPQVEESITWS